MAKVLKGKIISDKMDKTVVVSVDRYTKHPKYEKFFSVSKKFKVHDEKNEYKTGDKVTIKECEPMSRDKHFRVVPNVKGKDNKE